MKKGAGAARLRGSLLQRGFGAELAYWVASECVRMQRVSLGVIEACRQPRCPRQSLPSQGARHGVADWLRGSHTPRRKFNPQFFPHVIPSGGYAANRTPPGVLCAPEWWRTAERGDCQAPARRSIVLHA